MRPPVANPHFTKPRLVTSISYMTKSGKRLEKFKACAGPFPWKDLVQVLGSLGFDEIQGSGSRVKFRSPELDLDINLHKPHPGNEVKAYAVRQIQDLLAQEGLI